MSSIDFRGEGSVSAVTNVGWANFAYLQLSSLI
jgi:hypothetical protein